MIRSKEKKKLPFKRNLFYFVFILDFIMKLTISILSVFLLITKIGAPPVIEKENKDKDTDSKSDNSDEVVQTIIFY